MENQNQNNQINEINKPKSKFWKFALGFFGIILGIFILYIGGSWLWQVYKWYQWKQTVIPPGFEEAMEKIQQEDYEQAMADTYGDKTPQETLKMYIDAVEKGDYELASKYFIGDKQEKELNSFNGATDENIEKIINLLKLSIKNEGGYSWDGNFFSIDKPLYVSFKLYPNNIWKIIEI